MPVPCFSMNRRLRLTPLATCLALAMHGSLIPAAAASTELPDAHLAAAITTGGADIPVTNCNDSGPGSLREAVGIAASGDQIRLEGLTCSTITLTSGAIVVSQYELGMFGPGMDALTIDGGASQGLHQRVIDHTGTGLLTLSGFSIVGGAYVATVPYARGGCVRSGGSVALFDARIADCRLTAMGGMQGVASGGGLGIEGGLLAKYSRIEDNVAYAPAGIAHGGGASIGGVVKTKYSTIRGNSASTVTGISSGGGLDTSHANNGASSIYASTIEGNFAMYAGGIEFNGGSSASATISNSTISGNAASDSFGGVDAGIPLSINNSTIAFNHSEDFGARAAGIHTRGPLTLQSTIVANNRIRNGVVLDISLGPDSTISGADNLITRSLDAVPADTIIADPLLRPLVAYTSDPRRVGTHRLRAGSPAISAGNNSSGLNYDQRGFPRVHGSGIDIGAVEHQGPDILYVSNCEDGGPGSLRAAVDAAESGDIIHLGNLACSSITLTTGAIVVPQNDLIISGGAGPNRPARGDQPRIRINGGQADRVFRHDGTGALELWSLVIEEGKYEGLAQPQGGCIRSPGEVRLWNSMVTFCGIGALADGQTGPSRGGGIFAYSLVAQNSSITNNIAYGRNERAIGAGAFVFGHFDISDSTISGNTALSNLESTSGYAATGGGLYAMNAIGVKTCTMERSLVDDNRAQVGGGLVLAHFTGNVVIRNSTISGNQAESVGGVFSNGPLTLANSTLAFNRAENSDHAAGLHFGGIGLVTMQSSILANNLTNDIEPHDFSAAAGSSAVDGSNNLVERWTDSILPGDTLSTDPLLEPLADNGGPTRTHALQPGSPAIDTGNNVDAGSFDQRGLPRLVGVQVDIGAFERQGPRDSDHIFANGFGNPAPDLW